MPVISTINGLIAQCLKSQTFAVRPKLGPKIASFVRPQTVQNPRNLHLLAPDQCSFKTCLFKISRLYGFWCLYLQFVRNHSFKLLHSQHWCRAIKTSTLTITLADTSSGITSGTDRGITLTLSLHGSGYNLVKDCTKHFFQMCLHSYLVSFTASAIAAALQAD